MTTSEPEAKKKQLFIGVRVSVAAANALSGAAETLARRARDAGLDLRWVPAANYHATLKYLGWTREEAVPAIGDAIARAVAGTPKFELRVARLGAFPSLEKATVVWAGVADPGPITQLANKLDRAMAEVGFAAETRPFAPHVTVARLREGKPVREVVLPLAEQMFGGASIDHVILFESVGVSGSSKYIELRRISFKQALEREDRQTETVDLSASEDTDDGWPRGHS